MPAPKGPERRPAPFQNVSHGCHYMGRQRRTLAHVDGRVAGGGARRRPSSAVLRIKRLQVRILPSAPAPYRLMRPEDVCLGGIVEPDGASTQPDALAHSRPASLAVGATAQTTAAV